MPINPGAGGRGATESQHAQGGNYESRTSVEEKKDEEEIDIQGMHTPLYIEQEVARWCYPQMGQAGRRQT